MTNPLECSLPEPAMQRDPTAAYQTCTPTLLFARETEQNGREVTACFLPTDTVTSAHKSL